MDFNFVRRLIAFAYTLLLLLFIGLGFCYTNETNDYFRENSMIFNDYWKVDGKIITFPYSNNNEFTISNTLPLVYGDQLLIIRCYYEDFTAIINGEEIVESRPTTLFGISTNVGKKEIWIPLRNDYTNKEVSVRIKMQSSIYGSELTEAFITTRSAYGISQLKKNVPSVVLFVLFTVTGIIELFISAYFIVKRASLIRKLTFEALFYAGCFSIISAQWIINETRLPFIIFGYMTGFSVLNIISFLLMPLLFFELTRALFYRVGKIDNAIDGILALSIAVSCLLAVKGVIDWGNLVYIAHAIDAIVMILVGYYSYASIRKEKKFCSRTGIALANGIFMVIAGIALIQYIDNVDYNYILLIIVGLMIFIMVQVGLIYRRIGLNVKEEKEFAQAKIFAFTDELTKLSNRRHFYKIIDDYEKDKLPANLTFIAIDVNRLKYYNDTYGHEAGDELLLGTAECLRNAFSSSSTAVISRMGGDEFAVLLIAAPAELKNRLSALRLSLKKWKGKYIDGISVAIGYAVSSAYPDESIDELSKIADKEMYNDKLQFYKSSGLERRSSSKSD
ncbi:GGDEF domain-containing protein [Butyrivibrio hungatei]|uniref:GGDEF domain-containing protein n=1 Tax=Butyrivibrio hungatei TaxID=185008 RepID=A0A1D9P4A3_9FIRM|nr:GGDEF domain-containing protein [Butyrivibrio hungatei]AOZ96995.1 GGDEF domain-containing protein [Butyrivibrio hungatei]